ncbi:MAG: DUF1552 domain-containing protein [Myxococcales bacterium]|nr:DUF1552 domain-containing protein [Myxococcales bacterium]
MRLARRHFLRGASGVALGLPYLDLFAPKRARAQATPKRLLLLATGFSMDINRSYERDSFLPSGGASGITTLSPVLEPLADYRDRMIVVGGIDNVVAGLMSSNGHDASGKTLLACYPVKNAFDSSGNFRSGAECNWQSEIAGPSIDHHLAGRLGTELLPLSIGAVHGEHRMRWQQVGGSVVFDEGQTNPQHVFDRLFSGSSSGGGGASRPAQTVLETLRARRGSVLDAVLDQFRAVSRRAGREDRARLEQHADLVRAVERDVNGVATSIVCDDPSLSLPSNWNTASRRLTAEDGAYDDVILRTMGRLSALSMSCQASQVASIHMRNVQASTFPWLNGGSPYIPANWHNVVHHDAGTAQQRRTILQWHASALAEIVDMFANTPDGPAGTLLDSTLIMWVSSLRHSSHSTDDLPVLMVGDLQGTLRGGGVHDYQGRGSRSLGDLWTTVLNAMGVPDDAFGWNTGRGSEGRALNSGPLTELFA